MLNYGIIDDLESLNSFDLEALNNTLTKIKECSYRNLYTFQKDLVGIHRYNFKMSELLNQYTIHKVIEYYPIKYNIAINCEFIDKQKRLLYKRSEFFNKELNIFDISKNPDIFSSNYMVFVDGKFMDTINILPKEDKTIVIFDIASKINPSGIPIEYFNELLEKDAEVSVLIIQNCQYGVYTTDIDILKKNQNRLSLKDFDLALNLENDNKYVTFIRNNNLLFSSVITDTTNSEDLLRFDPKLIQDDTNNLIHLNVFGFRNLFEQIDLNGDITFFELPIMNMPVPIENILIFRNREDGSKVFAHDISLELYYPNIYKVLNNTNNDNLTLYVFYSSDNSDELKYTNDLQKYHELFNSNLQKYIDDTILPEIKKYMPPEFEYDINDYRSSQEYPNHLQYKLNKLSEWIDLNPNYLKEYYKNILKEDKGYYIDVSLVDLDNKLRVDNRLEVNVPALQEEFDEERYVFILKDELSDNFMNLRFYIDGLAYYPDKKWKIEGYELYYIPTILIKDDSIIEIEKFDSFLFSKSIEFNSITENKSITYSENKFSKNDIYLVNEETGEFINKFNYKISYFDKAGSMVTLLDDSFKTIPSSTIIVSIKDTNLLNKPISVYIQKFNEIRQFFMETNDTIGHTFNVSYQCYPSINNFRIFRKGRLLSSDFFKIISTSTMGGVVDISINLLKEIGEEFLIDFTPYSYNIVYQQRLISPTGVVDLRDLIPKPIDLLWYDIYLNGRRLNVTNIENISPYIIKLKNVKSLQNLLILEKNKDPDIFTPSPDSKTIIDVVWETFDEFKTKVEETGEPIEDLEESVIKNIFDESAILLTNFFNEFIINMDIINPDINQIPDEFKDRYNEFFDNNIFMINPDSDFSPYSYILNVNPDMERKPINPISRESID